MSPDGLLQQSSTVADSSLFTFADGITESIPRSYIEFAERLPLPQFRDLQDEEVCTICRECIDYSVLIFLFFLHNPCLEKVLSR